MKNASTRHEEVTAAVQDEVARFNAALKTTPVIIDSPQSLHHGHAVVRMGEDFWLTTRSPGAGGFTHSWAYCNDDRWAALLAAANVERHPLFAGA